MSAENYYTRIKLVEIPPEEEPFWDGVSSYEMTTQIDDSKIDTREKLRDGLLRAERINQPLKWLPRLAYTGAMVYCIAGMTGQQLPFPTIPMETYTATDQLRSAGIIFLATQIVQQLMENRLAKWESRKRAFNSTFRKEEVELVPEKFHPINLLKRIHPLQVFRRK